MITGAYVMTGDHRTSVVSLKQHLRDSLALGESFMDPSMMRPEEIAHCKWVEFGIGKGVTSANHNLSIFGVPGKLGSGWHGELVKGFPGIDPTPRCYEPDHQFGFGDFVRWVYFADPKGGGDYFGVDFGLTERATAGVGDSVLRVSHTARIALEHGVPANVSLVLLGPRMIEEAVVTAFRLELGLNTMADWAERGKELFDRENGPRCWKCGLDTRKPLFQFCYRCGGELS